MACPNMAASSTSKTPHSYIFRWHQGVRASSRRHKECQEIKGGGVSWGPLPLWLAGLAIGLEKWSKYPWTSALRGGTPISLGGALGKEVSNILGHRKWHGWSWAWKWPKHWRALAGTRRDGESQEMTSASWYDSRRDASTYQATQDKV